MLFATERTLALKSRLPIYVIGLLAFLQLVVPNQVWMALLLALVLLVGVSYLWAREMRDHLHATRTSRGNWVVAGDRLEERFQVQNNSTLPLLWATVRDHSDLPGYAIDRVVATGSRSSYSWRTFGVCSTRGVFTLGPWSLQMGDPLGLFEVTVTYAELRTLMVYPRIMHLPQIQLPRGRTSGRASRALPTNDVTVLARTVRDYSPGDDLRLVHWRKTAQLNEIKIKQFDLEPAGDIWLVLDLDTAVQTGADQESTLEYAVILAASLAAKYLDENRAVGLVAYGQEAAVIPPQSGRAHLWQILLALTHAEPDPTWPLARALKQASQDFGRGRTVLVITPSTETEWLGELLNLRRRDIATAALLLDAASFEGDRPSTLPALRGLLADQGIPSYVVEKGFPFRPSVTIKRKRKILKTLPGTGRVIAIEIEEEV